MANSDDETYKNDIRLNFVDRVDAVKARECKKQKVYKITNTLSTPRLQKHQDWNLDYKRIVGEKAEVFYEQYMDYKETDRITEADTLLSTLIRSYNLTQRLCLEVFNIGASRWSRLKKNQPKQQRGGCRGMEVRYLKIHFN